MLYPGSVVPLAMFIDHLLAKLSPHNVNKCIETEYDVPFFLKVKCRETEKNMFARDGKFY